MERATPNLPSRDFDATRAFYAALGFEANFQSAQWMILSRAGVTLEFFLHPNLNPLESWFSCCLRLDDLGAFYTVCRSAKSAEGSEGAPRLHPPTDQGGMRMAALIDIDGTLLRLIQN